MMSSSSAAGLQERGLAAVYMARASIRQLVIEKKIGGLITITSRW